MSVVVTENTKRAELLLRALDCFNRNAYEVFQKYLIFGGSLDDLRVDAQHPGQSEENQRLREVTALGEAIGEVHAECTVRRGRTSAKKRTSLDLPVEQKGAPKTLDRLKELGMAGMADELQRLLDAPYIPAPSAGSDSESDFLEAYFAKEVLSKLSKMVRRTSGLEPLELGTKVPDDVRKYFGEAHRCYIYGFPIACAVLCRAILASALEREFDPTGLIKNTMPHKKSYFERLVEEAAKRSILTDDRPEWSLKIRDAGNDAIHDLGKFLKRWDGKLPEILLNTRKVLIDLYAGTS